MEMGQKSPNKIKIAFVFAGLLQVRPCTAYEPQYKADKAYAEIYARACGQCEEREARDDI